MLDGYGLHKLVWDACDERFGDVLVASPADAGGRGISLAMRQSCTSLAGISGLANLVGVRSLRFTFASAAVEQLDFRGFDPSTLTDLYYTFSGCSKLVTIYADASWALPTRGLTGSQCFYNCQKLVGGNGTTSASSKTAYTYFRIDTASTPGYLTAG